MIRSTLRHGLRAVRDVLIGPEDISVIADIMRRDARTPTFMRATEYVDYERIPGDVIEFGVFAGLSLAVLAQSHGFDPKGMARRFVGFDSFQGLPSSSEAHARWRPSDCARTHAWHPLVPAGTPVTARLVRDLFTTCGLAAPQLHEGDFAETVRESVPAVYSAAAIVHFDCDLYESTASALEGIAPALQDGTMLLFDDWFHYRGHPGKGEARAFDEFLGGHPEWRAVHYASYATFCNAFILSRR